MDNGEIISLATKALESSKSAHNRLDGQEERLEKLEDNYAILSNINYRMDKVETTVENIDCKLDATQNEKGKKWDKLIDYIFYAVLGIGIGYIALKLGLK